MKETIDNFTKAHQPFLEPNVVTTEDLVPSWHQSRTSHYIVKGVIIFSLFVAASIGAIIGYSFNARRNTCNGMNI